MEKIGVVVGRFQIDKIHDGHHSLLRVVEQRSDTLIILLGCSSAKGTKSNPLDFETRKFMLQELFPNSIILPVYDRKSDTVWSEQVDTEVGKVIDDNTSDVTIYGSRDSCLGYYSGKYKTELLLQDVEIQGFSATDRRKQLGITPLNSEDFRTGAIYTAMNQYPKVHPTVDIAIFNDNYSKILLGRKHLETQFRFIGGFVDPTDRCLEAAAKREVIEECGDIEVDNFKYITSLLINDWRYRSEVDKIMTTLFTCQYIFGVCKGGDDIAEVIWVNFNDLQADFLVTEHGKLLTILKEKVDYNII